MDCSTESGIIRIVAFGSPEHRATLALRRAVLRGPGDPDFTADEIEAERGYAHVALIEGDEVVACLALNDIGNGLVQVHQLSVRPERRREGLGRRMMAYAEDRVRLLHARALVFYARVEAVPFYRALGYVEDAPWFQEVGVPVQMMAKRL